VKQKYPQGYCYKCGTKSPRENPEDAFTCPNRECSRFNLSARSALQVKNALESALKFAKDNPEEFLRRMKRYAHD